MGLIRNTAIVGGMTLVSRLLGFSRDLVLARFFGASLGMDAFLIAFKIPNFMRRLFGEGAFSLAFIPVLSEYKTRRSRAEVRHLVGRVAGTLGLVLFLVSILGALVSPLFVVLFAPGFLEQPEKYHLAASLLRLTFPYLFFIGLVAFASGILNTYDRFAVPAFAPVILNLVLIAAAFASRHYFQPPILALAWGVFGAGLLQLLFVLPAVARLRLLPRPRPDWRDAGVRRILGLMGPAVIGSSVAQVNLLFDTLIASFLVTGSVSWLYYSDRLVEFPLGVFGIALSTAILPSLSRSHAAAAGERFAATLDQALRWACLVGVPAALGLGVLAGPIIATLFHYQAFGATDTRMAALSLMAYSAGLPAFILVKILAPGFYARQDTRTPVRIAVIAMVTNTVLNLLLVLLWLRLHWTGPHAALAMATAFSSMLNALLLYRRLRRDAVYAPAPGWGRVLGRVALAGGAMVLVLWSLAGPLASWLQLDGLTRVTRLLGIIGAGAVTYLGGLWLLGQRLGDLLGRPAT